MRRLAWVAVVSALALSACGEQGPTPEQERATQVESQVRSVLKDPDSAQIAITDDFPIFDGHIVCGTVNAKNSFGGYVGARAFKVWMIGESPSAPDIASDESHDEMNRASCAWLKSYVAANDLAGMEPDAERMNKLLEDFKWFAQQKASEIHR